MRFKRRFALLFIMCAMSSPLRAGEWPQQPIRLIMPFPAGGPSDALARAIANKMEPALKTSIVVENVGGAGGSIGMQKLARSAPNGYTIGFGTIGTHAANMIVYRSPLYSATEDFEPLGLIGPAPMVLMAKKQLPVRDFKEFVSYLANQHSSLFFGSAGVGSISHIACLLLLTELKTTVKHVPYKGVAPAMAGLMGGETDFMCDQTTTALSQIKGGRVKPLAILTDTAIPSLLDVATASSSGLVQIDFRSWNALFAPRGTPGEVIRKLNTAINVAMSDPALIRQMQDLGVAFPQRNQNTPENLSKLVESEIRRLKPVLEKIQIN